LQNVSDIEFVSNPPEAIPKIIHQTWKTAEISEPFFRQLQNSWKTLNPEFDYRFWTDDDLEKLVSSDFPEYMDIFRGYSNPICRVDLGRYLILKKYGGVYADLDCECIKPISSILEGNSFVIGREPADHEKLKMVSDRGLSYVLCPSFIASLPDHPFWEIILSKIKVSAKEDDGLDATGPFLLSRAHLDWADKAGICILPPEQLYPFNKEDCWQGRYFDLVFWEKATRAATMVHYWDGSWFRAESERSKRTPRQVSMGILKGPASEKQVYPVPVEPGTLPLISCLMVTRGHLPFVKRAIECFQAQTYGNIELVIVFDGLGDGLAGLVAGFNDPRIRLMRPRQDGWPLGVLRNFARACAQGAYVCQWDDDDLYDPLRLEVQYKVLISTKASACILMRWMMWWPNKERLAVSGYRNWEGSLLCDIRAMPRYPAKSKGEDTVAIDDLTANARVAVLDLPRLYTYVVHGSNTFDEAHFEEQWAAASVRFPSDRNLALLREMGKRVPLLVAQEPISAAKRADAPRISGPKDHAEHVLSFRGKDSIKRVPSGLVAGVISLRESFNRAESLRRIEGEVASLGVPLEIWGATTPLTLPPIIRDGVIFNSERELACLSSHLALIKNLASRQAHYGLILEDDAILHPELDLFALTESAPTDWEILLLSTSQLTHYQKFPNYQRDGVPSWFLWHRHLWGAFAYIIHGKTLSKLVNRFWTEAGELNLSDQFGPDGMVADNLIFSAAKTYVSVYPWASFDRHLETTIQTGKSGPISQNAMAAIAIQKIWARG
jgi:mannosyltransferase OCH1-like enzyme/glycosyltransferase involved in cell wall biosynthesis